jgi:hypothetical protein
VASLHDRLAANCRRLPGDYKPWGLVERWADSSQSYPDCSHGCRFAVWLEGTAGYDWCVCTNPKSHRSGMLTFEHQGCQQMKLAPRTKKEAVGG